MHKIKRPFNLIGNLQNAQAFIQIIDARVPISSYQSIWENYEIIPKLLIINKSDLAEEKITSLWKRYFIKQLNITTIVFNAQKAKPNHLNLIFILNWINQNISLRSERLKLLLIFGVPNVGKSTLINRLVSKNKTLTGNRCGITKGKQWIKLKENLLLVDTPGVIHKNEIQKNEDMFLKLAITKNIYFEEEIWLSKIANFGLEFLIDNKFSLLEMYLQQKLDHKTMLKHFFSLLAKKMFYLKKGAELDIARTERKFVNDIQFGKLGRITWEKPSD